MSNLSFFGGIWINAFLINFLLIFLGQRLPFLTKKGWIHAGVLGTLLLGSIGWNGWISVCVYLLLGTLVTKIGFASTRIEDLQDCVIWLKETPHKVNQVWMVIGPEGGWNKDEEELAFNAGFVGVSMGETILRTSTAAVSACQVMTSWRRLKSSF